MEKVEEIDLVPLQYKVIKDLEPVLKESLDVETLSADFSGVLSEEEITAAKALKPEFQVMKLVKKRLSKLHGWDELLEYLAVSRPELCEQMKAALAEALEEAKKKGLGVQYSRFAGRNIFGHEEEHEEEKVKPKRKTSTDDASKKKPEPKPSSRGRKSPDREKRSKIGFDIHRWYTPPLNDVGRTIYVWRCGRVKQAILH